MSRFSIFVTVKLKPGSAEAFRPLILENATAAVRDEPECHEFHVMQSEDDAETFHLFEVYTSAASLDAHREMPHYKKYIETTKDMIADRAIQRVDVLNHPNVA
jgi:quinol monooxygenase YgiN